MRGETHTARKTTKRKHPVSATMKTKSSTTRKKKRTSSATTSARRKMAAKASSESLRRTGSSSKSRSEGRSSTASDREEDQQHSLTLKPKMRLSRKNGANQFRERQRQGSNPSSVNPSSRR